MKSQMKKNRDLFIFIDCERWFAVSTRIELIFLVEFDMDR